MNLKLTSTISAIIILVCIASCDNRKTQLEEMSTISIDIDEQKSISINEGTLIPLETNDSSLIYKITNLEKIGDRFIIHSRNLLKAFDATTGNYLGNLVNKGQGPGEVTSINQIWLEDTTVMVFDFNGKKLLSISPNGDLLKEMTPFLSEVKDKEEYSTPIHLMPSVDGQGYIALNSYTDGSTDHNPTASFYDGNLKFVRNIQGREMKDSGFINNRLSKDKENDRLLMWEPLKDTLFAVTKEQIRPIYAFDFGKNAFPAEYQNLDGLFDRYRKFKENPEPHYASLLQYFQKWNNYVFFIFTTSDLKNHIAVFNTDSHDSSVFNIADGNGKYSLDTFMKIFGNNMIIALTDNETEENNVSLLKLPVEKFISGL